MFTGEAVDGAEVVADAVSEDTQTAGEAESNRPEWLPAKFDNPEALVKSYSELETMIGKPRNSAPEEYEWGDYKEKFAIEGTALEGLTEKAKEMKLSQDEFSTIIDSFHRYQEAFIPDIDTEMAKLGDNPQQRLDVVNTWASNNLSENAIATFGKLASTAENVLLMDELRQIHTNTQSRVPLNGNDVGKVTIEDPRAIKEEIKNNYAKYQNDSGYRAELSSRLRQALGDD